MPHHRKLGFVCSLVLLLGARLSAAQSLAERIEKILAEPAHAQAHCGLLVVDRATGATVYERHPDELFVPASTTKLYTVSAAWEVLGPDQRFETTLVRQGQVDSAGTLHGDLILVASGDPTLGGRTTPEGTIVWTDADHTYANGNDQAQLVDIDPLAGLDALAGQVHATGIRRVAGAVRVDNRLFETIAATGSGPSQVTPIVVNDNLLDVTVTPTQPGEKAQLDWRPRTPLFEITGHVETVAADIPTEVTIEPLGPWKVAVRGKIAAGHKPLVRVQEASDPVHWAAQLLVEALERRHINVGRQPPDSESLPDRGAVAALPRVATLVSPPLREAAGLILKTSHNLAASTLPVLVGESRGRPTLADGLKIEHEFLLRIGVPVDTISLSSGAGGSRADRVTPRATVALLIAMARRSDFAEFRETLPILGVDGTLATTVDADSRARGRVQAKTGTLLTANLLNERFLLESKALAGYATTLAGRELAFAFFINNTHLDQLADTQREGRMLGRLCEVIVDDAG